MGVILLTLLSSIGAGAAVSSVCSGSLSLVQVKVDRVDRETGWPGHIDPEFEAEINREVPSGLETQIDSLDMKKTFADITRLAGVRGSHALVFSNGFGWEGGYASRVLAVMNEVVVAMLFRRPLAFCNNTFTDKVWTKYYDVQLPIFNDPNMLFGKGNWNMQYTYLCGYKFKEAGKFQVSPVLTATRFVELVKLKTFAYNELMRLKPEVQQRVDYALKEHGFGFAAEFIGVHVRHGDKAVEMENGLLPVDQYAKVLREEIDRTGIRKVYVASDDPAAKDDLQAMLGADVELFQQYDQNSGARAYDDEGMVMSFLIDMTAMQRAEVFIGTQSSNMGRMAFYMRGIEHKSISLDGDWSVMPKASSDCGLRYDSPEWRATAQVYLSRRATGNKLPLP